jgi:hypothetical protein
MFQRQDVRSQVRHRVAAGYPVSMPMVLSFRMQACYIVNDAVKDLWPEVEGRSKDYILNPKDNRYQSLHTTVQVWRCLCHPANPSGSHLQLTETL